MLNVSDLLPEFSDLGVSVPDILFELITLLGESIDLLVEVGDGQV